MPKHLSLSPQMCVCVCSLSLAAICGMKSWPRPECLIALQSWRWFQVFTKAEPEAQGTQRPIDLLRLTIKCQDLQAISPRQTHESRKAVASRTSMAVVDDITRQHPTCIQFVCP